MIKVIGMISIFFFYLLIDWRDSNFAQGCLASLLTDVTRKHECNVKLDVNAFTIFITNLNKKKIQKLLFSFYNLLVIIFCNSILSVQLISLFSSYFMPTWENPLTQTSLSKHNKSILRSKYFLASKVAYWTAGNFIPDFN